MKNLLSFYVLVLLTLLWTGCSKSHVDGQVNQDQQESIKTITAYFEESIPTRACITSELDGADKVTVMWSPSDALGVFTDAGENNIKYTNARRSGNIEIGTFSTRLSVSGVPSYGYYPYDDANIGRNATSLKGNIPQTQTMNLTTGMIPGDYKIGVCKLYTETNAQFAFTHIFSPIRIQIDGTGTPLSGDRLISVELTVTRGGNAVPVCGDFTFNATNGSYELGSTVSNIVKFDWTALSQLNQKTTAYATLFPEIVEGDKMIFTITTSSHIAVLEVYATTSFKANHIYTFPLILNNYTLKEVTLRSDVSSCGSFTCATYNVDGLPSLINSDGPGSDKTKQISSKIFTKKWDVISFSEDFDYHNELISALGTYNWGTYRGSVDLTALVGQVDTDGLNFASSYAFKENTPFTAFGTYYGSLTNGADECIKKGFRHYEVTIEDGVVVDFIITHMNTYKSDDNNRYLNAQYSQLTQIANYIKSLNGNNRPIIFMGDTNCRYTRNDFDTYFWSKLASDQDVSDPWVDYYWDGVYPTFGTTSIMPADAPDPSADELPLYSNQKGEVVDKIIYINDKNAPVQIRAISYKRDEDFAGMADHMPIVAEFYYEKTSTSSATHSALGIDSWDVEIGEIL